MNRYVLFSCIATLLACDAVDADTDPGASQLVSAAVGDGWVGTWGASPDSAGGDAFNNQTLREIVHTSIGGSAARVQLSNVHSSQPLVVRDVHLARRTANAAIDPATDRVVRFTGQTSITIPAGGLAVSDSIALQIAPEADYAVSLYLPNSVTNATIHGFSLQTQYKVSGDQSGVADFANPGTFGNWVAVMNLDVMNPASPGAVVVLGASIADGLNGSGDANRRWTNTLATRLNRSGRSVGVINQGIPGNGLLRGGGGPKAPDRFQRDVLDQPGVQWVIFTDDVVNDINTSDDNARPSAQALISATQDLIARAHARNVKFLCATLTPFNQDGQWTPAGEQTRQQFDSFARSATGGCDGFVDFDAALHSANDPSMWNPTFNSGDALHPNDAGLQAMGNAVSLDLFGPAGGATPTPISLAAAFNNVGVSDDTNTGPASWDGGGASFSRQALATAGLTPGGSFRHGGVTFTWPASAGAGQPDNAIATGQLIAVSAAGTTLGFLISASYGPASGSGTLQYSDGTTQSYTLASPDWFVTGSAPGLDVAVVSSYQNRAGNQRFAGGDAIFFVGVPLAAGKTLTGVRLPSAGTAPVRAGTPTLHVFALGI